MNPADALSLQALQADLHCLADATYACQVARFFKTGPGQYAAGDQFLGIRVPQQRRLVKRYHALPIADALTLVRSPFHEYRMCGLLLLVARYQKALPAQQTQIYHAYLQHLAHINNWDLVDNSAPYIPGAYTLLHGTQALFALAETSGLWARRVAMVATLAHIRAERFAPTLHIAKLLLNSREDLLHKATGWMLREVGKRDLACLLAFLDRHALSMPRVMLRYALERMPNAQRQAYLTMGKC